MVQGRKLILGVLALGLLGVVWVVVSGPGGAMVVPDPDDPAKTKKVAVQAEFDVHLNWPGVAVAWSGDSACFAATSYYGGFIDTFDRTGHRIGKQITDVGGPNVDRSLAVLSGCREVLFFPPSSRERTPNVLAFWDVMTGRPTRILQAPDVPDAKGENWAHGFILSQDEKRILTRALGPEIQALLYNVEGLSPSLVPYGKPGASSIALFPDSNHLVSGNYQGSVSVLNLNNYNDFKIFKIKDYDRDYAHVTICCVSVSNNAKYIALGVDSATVKIRYSGKEIVQNSPEESAWVSSLPPIKILHAETGEEIFSFSQAKRSIHQVAWDAKGRFLAFLDQSYRVFLWSPGQSEPLVLGFSDKSYSFALSPDGTRLAIVHGNTVSVFSIQ